MLKDVCLCYKLIKLCVKRLLETIIGSQTRRRVFQDRGAL